jgi:YfiH family protein
MTGPSLEESHRGGIPLLTDPEADSFGVTLGFTTREGGASEPPWEELNLSLSVGDEEPKVEANRGRVARALSVDRGALRFLRQVHGRDLLRCGAGTGELVGDGDALVTSEPGVALGILTADCVPVLLSGPGGVAAAHAGWRGLVAGVIEGAVDGVGKATIAWIGPSIRACCYEVGPEVTRAFESRGLPVAGPRRVDPADAARAALGRAGVRDVVMSGVCTSCDPRYYSYRRDGRTGRQGGFIAKLERAAP